MGPHRGPEPVPQIQILDNDIERLTECSRSLLVRDSVPDSSVQTIAAIFGYFGYITVTPVKGSDRNICCVVEYEDIQSVMAAISYLSQSQYANRFLIQFVQPLNSTPIQSPQSFSPACSPQYLPGYSPWVKPHTPSSHALNSHTPTAHSSKPLIPKHSIPFPSGMGSGVSMPPSMPPHKQYMHPGYAQQDMRSYVQPHSQHRSQVPKRQLVLDMKLEDESDCGITFDGDSKYPTEDFRVSITPSEQLRAKRLPPEEFRAKSLPSAEVRVKSLPSAEVRAKSLSSAEIRAKSLPSDEFRPGLNRPSSEELIMNRFPSEGLKRRSLSSTDSSLRCSSTDSSFPRSSLSSNDSSLGNPLDTLQFDVALKWSPTERTSSRFKFVRS